MKYPGYFWQYLDDNNDFFGYSGMCNLGLLLYTKPTRFVPASGATTDSPLHAGPK